MGRFITILILILAIAFVALLIYSKVKEVRGKDCSSCSGCKDQGTCSAQQQFNCQEAKDDD